MAIKSNAFGRLTLSGRDAKKFEAQVTYGRPKEVAKENAKMGIALSRKLRRSGGKMKVRIEVAS